MLAGVALTGHYPLPRRRPFYLACGCHCGRAEALVAGIAQHPEQVLWDLFRWRTCA